MCPKLPIISSKKLIQALKRGGFVIDHQTGSHLSMSHPKDPNRFAVIPVHTKDIAKGTFMFILRQAGISKDELNELL